MRAHDAASISPRRGISYLTSVSFRRCDIDVTCDGTAGITSDTKEALDRAALHICMGTYPQDPGSCTKDESEPPFARALARILARAIAHSCSPAGTGRVHAAPAPSATSIRQGERSKEEEEEEEEEEEGSERERKRGRDVSGLGHKKM